MPYSLYLHIPFCVHRCAYCDFNTYTGLGALIPEYVRALQRELELFRSAAPLPVHTVFLGGGTPSLLPVESLGQILHTVRSVFDLAPSAEISLEANPGTVTLETLSQMRASGFNRLSLGMQSARPEELRLLERQHDFYDVIRAVMWARQAGFDNLNLDLIFGIPGQTLPDFERSLTLGMNLGPQHLSLYSLTIEEHTPFHQWEARGLLPPLDPDLAADMYDLATDQLAAAGYQQYEISNWAKTRPGGAEMNATANPAFACQHNLQYWRNQPYLGVGAGAHGYANNLRVANVLPPVEYIERLRPPVEPVETCRGKTEFPRTPVNQVSTPIDRSAEIAETMMMGLRLTREGVSRRGFGLRFGQDVAAIFAPQIEQLMRQGLLEWAGVDGDALRLTPNGRLLGNVVFREFV